jgi:hypothetical protein
LFEEAVPELERKSVLGAAENGNEMVLESMDGSFRCILLMTATWSKLVVHINRLQKSFEDFGDFVV